MNVVKKVTGNWEEDCTGPTIEYGPEPPILTIGDLIAFLQTQPLNWAIGVHDHNGITREEIVIKSTGISTVLTSKGKEIEW